MGSTWAFKITASLIKPTRETLLDYCSYVLLIMSIIAIARVVIGYQDLNQTCNNDTHLHKHKITNSSVYWDYVENKDITISKPLNSISNSSLFHRNMKTKLLKINKQSSEHSSTTQTYCPKHYQAYFPYFLLFESLVLLFTGILWVKMPKVQSLVLEFSNLLHESRTSNWFKNIANSANQSSSILVKDYMEVHVLLEELFQTHTCYSDKAKARQLFEKIQKFCHDHENSRSLWVSYIRKSLIQFGFWLSMLTINIYLFIKLEFYVGCDLSEEFCSHDTFLRIIWFMSQLLIVVYGMFNCATLKWINEKSVTNGQCSFLKLFCGCPFASKSNIQNSSTTIKLYQYHVDCIPFTIDYNQKMVYNDMALLLHLVSSSNTISLPYFTVFLFDEWRERFSGLRSNYLTSSRSWMTEYRSSLSDQQKQPQCNLDNQSETSEYCFLDANTSDKLI